jgi:hypothetical protein
MRANGAKRTPIPCPSEVEVDRHARTVAIADRLDGH